MALQVTYDSPDPHALAPFYAVALGWELEDHHEMIGGLIEAGHVPADSDDVIEVDGRRRWRDYAALGPADAADGNRLLIQRGDEAKTMKNRVHLDVHVPEGERDAMVERLIGMGATRLWEGQQGPLSWVTLADPQGNELCIS